MSITSVKSGATGISLALDNNYMEPIATTLVGAGGVNQVTFNDIPQTYKHLQIRGIARGTTTIDTRVGLHLQVNSDTGANYTVHNLYADGASVGANGYANRTFTFDANYELPQADAIANVFGAIIIDCLDYKNTSKYKTFRALVGFDNNGTTGATGRIVYESGLWMDTNAITSIKLFPANDNWAQYSRFSLYGIKG